MQSAPVSGEIFITRSTFLSHLRFYAQQLTLFMDLILRKNLFHARHLWNIHDKTVVFFVASMKF